jgi:hypothetical protein
MPKTDKIEYERRIFTIQGWIIESVQSSLIVQQILAKEWCTSSRQAERMLGDARKRWIEHETAGVEERRLLKIQELKHLKRSLKDPFKGTPGGIQAVLAIEKEIIKLEGITPKPDSDKELKDIIVKRPTYDGDNG